jgi:hypothetical protein
MVRRNLLDVAMRFMNLKCVLNPNWAWHAEAGDRVMVRLVCCMPRPDTAERDVAFG